MGEIDLKIAGLGDESAAGTRLMPSPKRHLVRR